MTDKIRRVVVFAVLMAALGAGAGKLPAADVIMNNRPRPDLALARDGAGAWSFTHELDLRPDPAEWLAADRPQTDMRWKGWTAAADSWRNGFYGGHLAYELSFPYPVSRLTISALVSNFADGVADRQAFLEYSPDDADWHPVAEAQYGPGQKTFSGSVAIEAPGVSRLLVRVRQGARDDNARRGGSVVFQEFSFTVEGPEEASAEMRAAHEAAAAAAARREGAAELLDRARTLADGLDNLADGEREKAREQAVAAYRRALEIFPEWLLESAGEVDHSRWAAHRERGALWALLGEHEKERAEYRAAFISARRENLALRSQVQMLIGDSYFDEGDWVEAENAYLAAQRTGLYGDMRHLLPARLERVAPLAERQREERARAMAAGEALDLSLVVPDEPVYIPTAAGLYAAGRTQAEAAGRLQMLIERAGGGRPPIVPAAQAPAAGRRIFVGYGPHLEGRLAPPTEPEGLKIAEREGDLFLLGEIAPPGTNNWPGAVDRGLMHAVETFAERVMGYRFLVSDPGDGELFELGTAVPDLKQLDIPAGLLIEEAPVFLHRVPNLRHARGRIGLRSGSAPAFNCNHSYHVAAWARRYAEEHPELFIPRVDEETAAEDGDLTEAMGARRHLNFLDHTEPLVLEKHLEHLQEFFETGRNPGGVFYRRPTITHIMEEPPDWPAPSFRYNERSRELWNPNAKSWGRFSNIWFDYLSRLGREVKERWPHMRISTLAYYRHYDTPTFDIPDNIDVMLALMRTSMGNKEPYVFEKNLAHVEKWSEFLGGDRSRLFLWEYGCWPSFWVSPPLVAPFAMQRWLQAVRPHVSGVWFEHYDPAEFYLMPRLWMRLLWDPDLDVDAEIADLCGHLYGPGGESMAAFYRRLIERFETEWENPRLVWDQYYLTPDLYYGQSYPRAETDRLAALLEEARRAAGLPAALEARARHGTAVHLYNLEAETVPVAFTLSALEHEIVDPAIGWEGGRLAWRGRLQPSERLEIDSSGRSTLNAWDGTSRAVEVEFSGAAPEIRPESSAVFHFWHGGAERAAAFRAALAYGPGAAAGPEDIYRRRLEWLRDVFLVFQPGLRREQRGFLAEAHVAHRFLGRPPFYEAPDLQGLPGDLDDPRWGNIPAAGLVVGRNEWSGEIDTYQRMGFPAGRRTLVRFAYDEREGLAVLVEAEGAPLAGESFELAVGERTVRFSPSGKPGESPAPAALEPGERSWRALMLVGWEEIGLTPGRGVPAELRLQVVRTRGDDHYLWSPPLGSGWGHGRQGPGLLRLANR